jgi:HMG (high mobility group) box
MNLFDPQYCLPEESHSPNHQSNDRHGINEVVVAEENSGPSLVAESHKMMQLLEEEATEDYGMDTEPLPHRPLTPPPPCTTPQPCDYSTGLQTPPSGEQYLNLVSHTATVGGSSSAMSSTHHAHYAHSMPYSSHHSSYATAMPPLSAATVSSSSTMAMPPQQQPSNMSLWTAGMVNGVSPPGEKPKRPLSAYNFFFQLERERIVDGHDDCTTDKVYTVQDVARVALLQQQKLADPQPKEKRSHRKTHGKISFGDLARTIATRWKRLDEASKAIFDSSASLEKERYRRELAEWTKQQKKWKEAAAKLTSSMRQQPQLFNRSSSNSANSYAMTSNSYHGGNGGCGGTDVHNSSDEECVVVTPTKSPPPSARSKFATSSSSPSRQEPMTAAALMNQQSMLRDSLPGSGMHSRSKSNMETAMTQQTMQEHLMRRKSLAAGSGSGRMVQASPAAAGRDRRYSTGAMMQPYSGTAASSSGMTSMHSLPYINLDDDLMDNHCGSGGAAAGAYDYDTVADETYAKAYGTLPEQPHLRPKHSAYQAMLHQRRMRMLGMMQQQRQQMAMVPHQRSMLKQQQMMQQRQQQMMHMMTMMNQSRCSSNGRRSSSASSHMDMGLGDSLEQSIQHQEQQRQMLMEQMAELSGHGIDDETMFLDPSGANIGGVNGDIMGQRASSSSHVNEFVSTDEPEDLSYDAELEPHTALGENGAAAATATTGPQFGFDHSLDQY